MDTKDTKDVVFHQLVAYLKGEIVGFAVVSGKKYESNKERTTEFDSGFNVGSNVFCDSTWITVRHILHNRLRHKRAHTGSCKSDQAYIDKSLSSYPNQVKRLLDDIEGALGTEARTMSEDLL